MGQLAPRLVPSSGHLAYYCRGYLVSGLPASVGLESATIKNVLDVYERSAVVTDWNCYCADTGCVSL